MVRSIRRVLGVAGATVVVLGALGSAPSTAAPPPQVAPDTDPTVGPLVAGTSAWVDGTFVWTDYVYDDAGDGGATYADEPGNLADLVQLQVSRAGGAWRITAVLETLLDPAVPVLGVGVDTDADPTTGAAAIPGGAWSPSDPLGLETFAVVRDGATTVLRADPTAPGGWTSIATRPAAADPEANTLTGELAPTDLPANADAVRVVAVLGPADAEGGSWADGSGEVFDLAFVGDEPPNSWQSTRQAAILAGDAPSDGAVATIDPRDLRTGRTHLPDATSPGFHTRLYRSALDFGEGIRSYTLTGPGYTSLPIGDLYAGPYQPYLVWVPDELPADPPTVLMMHGFGGTHLSLAGLFPGPDGSNDGGELNANFTPDSGLFDLPAVAVSPLGRGQNSFYIGAGEQDVLDAVDDAVAAYGGDPDRVVLSGVSMGGFGTFRLGVRYPDRWSAAVALIGTGASAQDVFPLPPEVSDPLFPPAGFPGGSSELLENVRNLPWRMVNGLLDPIVDTPLSAKDAATLTQLGYDFRYWSLTKRNHEVVPAITNCVYLQDALPRRRVADPARVTYSVEPALFVQDPASGLDLTYDGAYWVDDLVARPEVDRSGEEATIDVTSLARPDRTSTATPLADAGVTVGADLCGENPDVTTGDPWTLLGTARSPGPAQPTSNGLELSVTQLTSARLDLTRAGLTTDAPVVLEVTGDGPAELRLAAPWGGTVAVTWDGEPAGTLEPRDGEVVVAGDLDGAHTIVLTPTGAADRASTAVLGGAGASGGGEPSGGTVPRRASTAAASDLSGAGKASAVAPAPAPDTAPVADRDLVAADRATTTTTGGGAALLTLVLAWGVGLAVRSRRRA